MTKTAAIILNHNMPDYTDMLYESLKPYERNDYELFVLDNGSKPEGKSKYTSFVLEQNVYFGGGLNASMEFIKENKNYDSLLFLSNDLTIHPYNFVKILREEMFDIVKIPEFPVAYADIKYDIVSPTFYNIEPNQQCHWKAMHCRGSKEIRQVPYSDFQCPLISRRLVESVDKIDSDLMYGWGPDWLFALTAKKLGYKIGVVDRCCILHHNSLTVKRGVAGLDIPTYCKRAESGMYKFFQKSGLYNDYVSLRNETELYEYTG